MDKYNEMKIKKLNPVIKYEIPNREDKYIETMRNNVSHSIIFHEFSTKFMV